MFDLTTENVGLAPVMLTGDRPSGPLHLGHYVGSLKNRVLLQDKLQSYIMIADIQALTDNFHHPEKVREFVYEVAKDYLAVGIDPDRSTIFVQSQIPELMELTCYYMNFVTLGRLERNPTVKAEIQQKNMEKSIPVGFFCYPISQAADITAFGNAKSKIIVPVGADQLPMIEQSNEIVKKFNHTYKTDCLSESQAYLSDETRLIGIDGKNKASKTLNNAIFLNDDPDTIQKKIFSMFTDPHHIRAEDPGNVEGNTVFAYLSCFHPDAKEVEELKEHYKRGGLSDMTLKNLLNQDVQTLLRPIREKRAQYAQEDIHAILKKGTARARQKVQCTLQKVRHAMKLDAY
jgi:tryptophanyl-tRNA synthetase